MTPEPKNVTCLSHELQRLAKTENCDVVLNVDDFSPEEQEAARAFNQILSVCRTPLCQKKAGMALNALTAVLNNVDALVLATVPETGEILFINDHTKKFFGVVGNGAKQRCHEFLYGRTERCDFCMYPQLEKNPDTIIQWEALHMAGKMHHMVGMLIDWPGGGKAHLEFGVEKTDAELYAAMLKSILNGMEALICVCEFGSFEILFLNDSIRKHFGLKGDGVGQVCYKFLQGRDEPCDLCPYRQLQENPETVFVWEHHEAIKGSILNKTARSIDWPGGKKAHLEYAVDITELKRTQEKLERREKMLDIINRTALILLRREDASFSAAMNEGIGLIADIANIDRMSVFRNAEKPDGLHASQLYLWQKQTGSAERGRKKFSDIAYAALFPRWEKMLSMDQHICGLVRFMPEADMLRRFGCMSILVVPVFDGGKFWGFVIYEKLIEEDFTSYEIDVLRSASFMLANAVMRNEEAAMIREAHEHAMLMLNAAPYGCLLWDQNRTIIACNDAFVTLLGRTQKIYGWEGFRESCPEFQPDGRASEEKSLEMLNRAFDSGKHVFEWTYKAQDGTLIPAEVTLMRVRYGDAFVVVESTRDLRVERKMEKDILQLESEVEKIYYDPLTGIYNRRFLEKSMDRQMHCLSRSASALSLMMIDIDYFKQYNDTYGHIKGDECLKLIAETLRKNALRMGDIVARYGGEEFVVILPNTDEHGARMFAKKLLSEVRNLQIPHAKSDVANCVTISIGVVSGKVSHTDNRDDYLHRADEMLYASKQGGRNRYTFTNL